MCLSVVQVGAGGFGVPLPRRSRSRRLFVSRQPDQGRRPGLQQRGQLHVTAALPCSARLSLPGDWLPVSASDVITAQSTHNTKHTDSDGATLLSNIVITVDTCLIVGVRLDQADVQFALGD